MIVLHGDAIGLSVSHSSIPWYELFIGFFQKLFIESGFERLNARQQVHLYLHDDSFQNNRHIMSQIWPSRKSETEHDEGIFTPKVSIQRYPIPLPSSM